MWLDSGHYLERYQLMCAIHGGWTYLWTFQARQVVKVIAIGISKVDKYEKEIKVFNSSHINNYEHGGQ